MRCLLFLALSLCLVSCSNDDSNKPDCSAVSCVASGISLDLVSQDEENNLFEDGTLEATNITITNKANGNEVNFQLDSENILVLPIGNYTNQFAPVSYEIANNDEVLFTVNLEAKREQDLNECSPNDLVQNVAFPNTQTEKPDESIYFYRVFLNL